jgi:hypothetical protein
MNPIDILGVHPGGALEKPYDRRDYDTHSPEMGMASAPFDWYVGYDVEKDLGIILPTKDQGQSSSCGGQTVAQQAQVLGENVERSAKAYYAQVYAPGGGSNSRMLGNILVKQGLFKESLVPSYMNGDTPTEAFMERPADVTPEAKADASTTANLFAYSFPNLDIDSMAQALRDNKNLLIGIIGSNNGTWLSGYPSADVVGRPWAHFMAGGKAELVKGKKTIWAKQSWGAGVAPQTNSYQAITEDHFKAGHIWDAMVFHSVAPPPPTNHVFNKLIVYRERSSEVTALQIALANKGVFNVAPTGYYGAITAQAVLKLRTKYGVSSATDPFGWVVGPKTRQLLNS